MEIQQVETLKELGEWLAIHMPKAIIDEIDGEIVISTGLAVSMGGYLNPIEEEDE